MTVNLSTLDERLLDHEMAGRVAAAFDEAAGFEHLLQLFQLDESEARMLNEVPYRGAVPVPPTDPLIYRFYELVLVYGTTWKELIQEEFGDGIMSAIDFDMAMERVANPKGDRVKITMSGKFLPYKYYGASGNVPEYGFKEG